MCDRVRELLLLEGHVAEPGVRLQEIRIEAQRQAKAAGRLVPALPVRRDVPQPTLRQGAARPDLERGVEVRLTRSACSNRLSVLRQIATWWTVTVAIASTAAAPSAAATARPRGARRSSAAPPHASAIASPTKGR